MDFRFEDLVNLVNLVSDQGRIAPYIIDQTGDENKEKYEVASSIKILRTGIIRIVWQTVRRITNEILGVKKLGALA